MKIDSIYSFSTFSFYQSNTGVNNMNYANNMNINNTNKQMAFNTSVDEPMDDFSTYIFENINKIRENPQFFMGKIEKTKSNII